MFHYRGVFILTYISNNSFYFPFRCELFFQLGYVFSLILHPTFRDFCFHIYIFMYLFIKLVLWFRFRDTSSSCDASSKRYVITNPPDDFSLLPTDQVCALTLLRFLIVGMENIVEMKKKIASPLVVPYVTRPILTNEIKK